MPKSPRPFRWRNGWYTDAGGSRTFLLPGTSSRRDAEAELRRLLTERDQNDGRASSNLTVSELFALFLDTVKVENDPTTYDQYQRGLTRFAQELGASSLMPRSAQTMYLLALAAYGISFLLPALVVPHPEELVGQGTYLGFEVFFLCLFFAAIGLHGTIFIWLANPAFWVAAVLIARKKTGMAAFSSGLAVLLGVWLVGTPNILVGYYVWLGSFMLLFVGVLVEMSPLPMSLPKRRIGVCPTKSLSFEPSNRTPRTPRFGASLPTGLRSVVTRGARCYAPLAC